MVQYRVVQSTSGDTEGNRSSAYTLPQNRLFSAENTAAPLSPQENHAERTERRHDGYMHGYMRGYEQEHAAFMHLSPRDLPPPATTTFGPSSPHKTHAYRPLADYYPDVADDYYAGGPGSGPMAEWFFPHQPQTPRSAAHHNYAAFATPSLGHRAEHFRSLFSPVQNRSGSVDSTISLNLEDLPSQPQQNNGGTQERGATPPHLYITPSRLFTSTVGHGCRKFLNLCPLISSSLPTERQRHGVDGNKPCKTHWIDQLLWYGASQHRLSQRIVR